MGSEGNEGRHDKREAVRAQRRTGEGPELSASEAREVERKLPPSVQVLHEAVRVQGDLEMDRSASALAWSSVAAGLSMGFSVLAPALLQAQLPDGPGWGIVAALGYTVGFLIVIIARQQLFTENTTTAVLPLMSRPGLRPLLRLLRLWGIVLIGNLAGGALFAYAIGHLPILDAATYEAMRASAERMFAQPPSALFCTGVVAGWLIATMVWLVAAIEGPGVMVIVAMTWLVGLGGFAHVIVGSIEGLFLVFGGHAGFGAFFGFLLPTLAGNVVGGSVIFALISHAQVRSDEA